MIKPIHNDKGGVNPPGRLSFFALVLITLLALLYCGGRGKDSTSAPRPNIILITIDTLRADHLSCYGYKRPTSPFMDRLAQQSMLFTQAYSVTSWTAPSMASIFTGLYPRQHGVQHGMARGPRASVVDQEKLPHKFPTIAETLKKNGYTTFGISSNGHMCKGTGFARGFDHFITHWFEKSPASNITAKKWQKKIKTAEPYFLWIHYFDPHNPYNNRMPWIKTYVTQSGSFSKWSREPMGNPKEYIEDIRKDPKALQTLIDRYDSEINYCDSQVKELLEHLAPGDNTMIIITSDHGEAFMEHDNLLHGETLFEEEIRVPLMIKLPGKNPSAGVSHVPVSNRHIFATIAGVLELEDKDIPGLNLSPPANAPRNKQPEPLYFELDWLKYAKAVRDGQWKLLLQGKSTPRESLYNMTADPGEKNDRSGEKQPETLLLKEKLAQWLRRFPQFIAPKIKTPVNKDHQNKLKSLGYLN